jgi:hypothetical protein
MNVRVAKTRGTIQKTICRHEYANERFSGFRFSQCIPLLNGLFSFDDFFKHEKYFIGDIETNADRYRDDKKENNLHN